MFIAMRFYKNHIQVPHFLNTLCKKQGLLIGKGGLYGNVLRISPPLTVTLDEVDRAGSIISAVVGSLG